MAKSISQLLEYMLPAWARTDEAAEASVAEVVAALIDASLVHVRAAVLARFPSRSSESALARTGVDRLILRGRTEAASHYAARLRAWRSPRGHRVRGNAYALLEQIYEYFGAAAPLWGIDVNGNKRRWTGTAATTYGYPWTWDAVPASQWARQWIVIEAAGYSTATPGTGDAPQPPAPLFAEQTSWSGDCVGMTGCTPADWTAIRSLFAGQHRWLPAGMQGEWIVVMLTDTAPAPDGLWGKWGKVVLDEYLPAREASCRYVAIRSALRDYGGDDDWAAWARTSLITMGGDDTVWSATITTPEEPYGGDTATWDATIRLPDDGVTLS